MNDKERLKKAKSTSPPRKKSYYEGIDNHKSRMNRDSPIEENSSPNSKIKNKIYRNDSNHERSKSKESCYIIK